MDNSDNVNHPKHYGGADNPFEPIKIIEYYDLGFCLGNAIKYILRAPFKGNLEEDLKKAEWYLNREIERLKVNKMKPDERLSVLRVEEMLEKRNSKLRESIK